MTDQEIKEEARRRIADMTEAEKDSVWGFTEDDKAFLDHVVQAGRDSLAPKERTRYRQLLADAAARTLPGGMIEFSVIDHVRESYGISREDMAGGARNPYGRLILILCLAGIGVATVGAVLAVAGSRMDNDTLKYVGAGAGMGTLGIAVTVTNQLTAYFRYRKIQKRLMSGEMDGELVRAEVCSQLFPEKVKIWESGPNPPEPSVPEQS